VIEVSEQFTVPAAAATVWALLADPEAVVGCVPGAAIVGVLDDGALDTTLSVKFGPLRVAFQARAVLELEPERMHGRLTARGKDNQGAARFQASAAFDVAPHASGALVTLTGEVDITGRLASLIEGGANVVVKQMSTAFAACLSARCTR
jgi:carbon monoxide dehydrogenase subunit G